MQLDIFKINELTIQYKPSYATFDNETVNKSEIAHQILRKFYNEDTIALQEHFIILLLNNANRVIGGYKHSVGGITGTLVDVRIVLSVALKSLATSMVISHNHPSGKLIPSNSDKDLTKRLKDAAKLVDITLQDHLILSPEGTYFSFADEGLL